MANERFLLVQLADIGDLVLTTPAIAALREAQPGATIDLFASEHALPVIPDGLVDNLIAFRRRRQNATSAFFAVENLRSLLRLSSMKYDAVVFFHHFTWRSGVLKFWLIAKASRARRIVGLKNPNIDFLTEYVQDAGFGAKHQAQYWLDLVALLGASSGARPALVRHEAFSFESRRGSADDNRPRVVIHSGSGGYSIARRWLPQRFAAVAQQIQNDYDAEIILVGRAEDDGQQVQELLQGTAVDLVGETTLPQLADVIARANLFIGADSGVMHIAAATGTPVISIFGPSNAAAWRPWALDGRAEVLRSGVECSPCSYVGHKIGARDGCPARTCMKLITDHHVLDAARRILAEPSDSAQGEKEAGAKAQADAEASRLRILDVPVDAITYAAWMEQIGVWVRERDGAQHVCTVNPEFIMIAQRDAIFCNILTRAAICVPDGVGLHWASRHLGAPLPERVTGSDGVPVIARHAAQQGWKIYFLGAAEGVAARAAELLRQRYPGLIVAGTYGGSPAESEEDEIVAMVNASGADILFVAYGAPVQDKWIARNLPRLDVAMAMGVGGSLDFIAGVVPRAPQWMRDRGIEWLYRLIRQPWRLRRMLRLPRFVIAVLRESRD